MMATNLTSQVRNIAEVTSAVAHGDLSNKITVDVTGEILVLKDTINTMVDQLSSFASSIFLVSGQGVSVCTLAGVAPGVRQAETYLALYICFTLAVTNMNKKFLK